MEQRLRTILAGVIGVLGVLLAAGILGSVHPADFAAAQRYFSIAEIIRSRSYFIHGVVPVMVLRMVVFGLLVTAIIKRWTILPLCVKKRGWKTYINNAFSIFVLLAVLELLRFPAAFYAGYLREGEFGLRNAGFSLWLYRYGFSSLISFVALWGMLSVFIQFIAGTKRFIIFIPLVFFVLSMGTTVLLPRVITPLFYEVSSLRNVELRNRIQGIMEREGLPVSDIRVVHTSRYSKKANAYFTGFGRSREIYLYDTLLKNFSRDEILTVISHELCHYSEEHVLIGLSLVSAGIAAGLAVMMLLCRYLFGVSLRDLVSRNRIAELMFLLLLILFIARPVYSSASRYMERRADRFALRPGGSPEAFISLQVKLAKKNIAHLAPNPLYVWFYDTHPPVMERIQGAERCRTVHGDSSK